MFKFNIYFLIINFTKKFIKNIIIKIANIFNYNIVANNFIRFYITILVQKLFRLN